MVWLVVLVLVVEESLLFMREHTPITELLPVMVEQVVVVDLTQEVLQIQIHLDLVEQEQLPLFRLMLQHHKIKV